MEYNSSLSCYPSPFPPTSLLLLSHLRYKLYSPTIPFSLLLTRSPLFGFLSNQSRSWPSHLQNESLQAFS